MISDKKCSTVYEDICETTYREECSEEENVPNPFLRALYSAPAIPPLSAIPLTRCKQVPITTCAPGAREKCEDIPREVCQRVPVSQCNFVPRESCVDVPVENCVQVRIQFLQGSAKELFLGCANSHRENDLAESCN